MRRIKFIILAIPFLLMACEPTTPQINSDTCLPDGWEPLQRDLIKSYFMLDKDSIKYVSEDNEEMCFHRDAPYREVYQNSFCKNNKEEGEKESNEGEDPEGLPHESYSISTGYDAGSNKIIKLDFLLFQRCHMFFNLKYSEPDVTPSKYKRTYGSLKVKLEMDEKKNQGLGWPKNPNEYKSYLTGNIQLKDDNGVLVGELVSGRGLVWFIDPSGKRWNLR